ncbi:hypothetical protein QBC34DRAFT_396284 [Podospora aff. communis PSN243]|uniref:Origin recognition complex subunit 2 n=1 Tax=Podospora aff. communis PSN243 TaxID=3040156 RepID=A0AAV9GYJ9_9PEZI|nr:hypothetical protein QBC34DRAFT_396284 [Podospora aff. communis PSN243]
MVRRKAQAEESAARSPKKRVLEADPYEVPDDVASPKRNRATGASARRTAAPKAAQVDIEESVDETQPEPSPTKRRPGRPPKANSQVATPSALRQEAVVATPIKLHRINGIDAPSRKNNADRSARRKSAKALIDRVVGGAISDDEGKEEDIAREIYESSEEDEEEVEQEEPVAATPSKRGPGRPRKNAAPAARKRSPTPPRDLPPQEQYFYQNKPGLTKTSGNNLSSLNLLTHEEYFSILRKIKDPHAKDVEFLQSLHAESFPQWAFELSQGFSTCLYGYGSKRRLLHRFATYLSSKDHSSPPSKIVIINGYVRTTSLRDILSTIGTAASQKLTTGTPVAMVQSFLTSLTSTPQTTLLILINSIDALPLRKPGSQSILAQLAAHPQIRLVCSADTPDFPFLWDSGQRSLFNFTFHDCTTFAPFGPELDTVDEVHELLGRKARRVGGKEGVAFVLRSLPENAKSLFRLLVTEVLVAMDETGGGGSASAEGPAVEYRMVYNKAVEEFICSSEMAFRTLLKEFHDHQIITSHKDSLGTELLSLPFRKDELEAILEDLMS